MDRPTTIDSEVMTAIVRNDEEQRAEIERHRDNSVWAADRIETLEAENERLKQDRDDADRDVETLQAALKRQDAENEQLKGELGRLSDHYQGLMRECDEKDARGRLIVTVIQERLDNARLTVRVDGRVVGSVVQDAPKRWIVQTAPPPEPHVVASLQEAVEWLLAEPGG